MKDIAKIIGNDCPKNKNDLMIITKKKKIIFYEYNYEIQKLYLKEYKNNKYLVISLKEIPEKIKWYGDNIYYYYLKQNKKVIFNILETDKKNITKIKEAAQDIPVEDISFIKCGWATIFPDGLCFFLKLMVKTKIKI